MRQFALIAVAVQSSFALSANMTAVPKDKAHCARIAKDYGADCYEWALVANRSIRIVFSGYEDGASTTIYRVDKAGTYHVVATVEPALRDSSRPGQLFFGYAWDVRDIELVHTGGVVAFRATYMRTPVSDEETEDDEQPQEDRPGVSLVKRRAIPFVLFSGKTTQPDMTVRAMDWKTMTPEQLESNDDTRIREQSQRAEEELRRANEALKKH